MGSAHSAGHAEFYELGWTRSDYPSVVVRSGPKGLWAKLDDRSSTGHSCLSGVAYSRFQGCVCRVQGWCNEAWLAYPRLTGCSRLDTAKRERLSRARPVIDMDPAPSDGLGNVVSSLGLYSMQAGGQWDTSCEGKPEKLSSVMQCGERPSSQAGVAHHSR